MEQRYELNHRAVFYFTCGRYPTADIYRMACNNRQLIAVWMVDGEEESESGVLQNSFNSYYLNIVVLPEYY